MARYAYAYHIERQGEEMFFLFPKFPEIISAIPLGQFSAWDETAKEAHAADAVVAALQSIIAANDDIPEPDNARLLMASGFVFLTPIQAMKLQVYRVYLAHQCKTVADFARRIGKQDTTARRILNLSHRSVPDEIEETLRLFGRVLEHDWDVGPATAGSERQDRHARETSDN